jgi:hypothetical protein
VCGRRRETAGEKVLVTGRGERTEGIEQGAEGRGYRGKGKGDRMQSV